MRHSLHRYMYKYARYLCKISVFHAFFIKRDVSMFEKCLCCEDVCIWKMPASENREMFVLERDVSIIEISL